MTIRIGAIGRLYQSLCIGRFWEVGYKYMSLFKIFPIQNKTKKS